LLKIYFIRHGQSTNNVVYEDESKIDYFDLRKPDPDLTAVGEEQARIVADYLNQPYTEDGFDPHNRNGFGLTHLYCSLMIRAVKTGNAISKATGLPLVAWPEIHETGGVFDVEKKAGEPVFIGQPGLGRSFFKSEFPNLVIPDDLPEEGWWNREIEPRENYRKRGRKVVNELLKRHGGSDHRVGLVLHGGIFTKMLTAIFEVQTDHHWFLMNNCAISRVDVRDDGHVMLAYMNSVDHLPDHLIT
jgi:2,3-bisphosphoglycerate-dependent phosphoglycerate mutase